MIIDLSEDDLSNIAANTPSEKPDAASPHSTQNVMNSSSEEPDAAPLSYMSPSFYKPSVSFLHTRSLPVPSAPSFRLFKSENSKRDDLTLQNQRTKLSCIIL